MSGQIICRSGNRYTQEEKHAIVKDYIESNLSRNAIVKKYQIGYGSLIAWLRIFGVEKDNVNNKSVMVRKISKISKTKSESKTSGSQNGVNQELLKRIEELEEALEYEKLRSLAYSTMIDIAEEDFKIEIRKKDGAKQ